MNHVKIATLNIQHGGGRRIPAILDFLIRLDSDALVLSEYRLNDKELSANLRDAGYCFQVVGSALPNENTVMIASREPFEPLLVSQRIASVKLNSFTLFGVYFPQGEEKRSVYEKLKTAINDAGDPALVMGDFNTGIHYQDETGKSFACADSFESLKDIGLVDSWRVRNPLLREFSWYSSQGNGFRIDHAFCSKELDQKVSNVEYIHTSRELKMTDHSALVVEIF